MSKTVTVAHAGEIMAHIRGDMGLTRKELADKLGCFHFSIYRWEKGKARMNPEYLDKLLDLWNGKTKFVLEFNANGNA